VSDIATSVTEPAKNAEISFSDETTLEVLDERKENVVTGCRVASHDQYSVNRTEDYRTLSDLALSGQQGTSASQTKQSCLEDSVGVSRACAWIEVWQV
jgi:hypothetical protein